MLTTTRSLVASNRDAAELVKRAEKFSVRLPIVGKVSVPPPDQLAFYGVLGLLAAVEVIDWPVALAIGVGQAVMARHLSEQQPAGGKPGGTPTATRAEVPTRAAAKKAQPRKATASKAQPRKATKAAKRT